MVAQTGAEMANAILGLFDDPERRRALEREARKTVERDFDWDAIAQKQRQLYVELTELARERGIV